MPDGNNLFDASNGSSSCVTKALVLFIILASVGVGLGLGYGEIEPEASI